MQAVQRPVLVDVVGGEGALLWAKRAALVAFGVVLLALAAKVKVFMWPSPVPVTLGTFAVLSIGAAYGARLGLVTILGYMAVGAIGYDVFASSSAERNGLEYMIGGTGGYLVGYVLAVAALGYFARRGWDRNIALMALAMLIGNALIYVPGVAWLHVLIESGNPLSGSAALFNASTYESVWSQTMTWGLTPYLIGDGLKLAAAALIFPLIWRAVGDARA
ncbi:MAG: biotin transporter BioY [Pseudomonadota bacterium]